MEQVRLYRVTFISVGNLKKQNPAIPPSPVPNPPLVPFTPSPLLPSPFLSAPHAPRSVPVRPTDSTVQVLRQPERLAADSHQGHFARHQLATPLGSQRQRRQRRPHPHRHRPRYARAQLAAASGQRRPRSAGWGAAGGGGSGGGGEERDFMRGLCVRGRRLGWLPLWGSNLK